MPEVGRGVLRECLVARLSAASSTPVVVISAPAGAGKSTLARQWQASDQRRHVLVELSPQSDDVAALADLVVDALEQVGPSAHRARTAITLTEPAFTTVTLPAVTRLATSRASDYVLVIDDLQLVTDPACHRLLRVLTEVVPPGSQLALLSREATPSWLARARSEGRLLELTAQDLAFSADEAALVFAVVGVAIDPTAVSQIVEQAEGWAVAVYLTALAMRDNRQPVLAEPPLPHGTDRYILDYLRTEVLDSLDADRRGFLLRTSVLDELRPDLCDAVLGRADAAAVLDSLHTRLQLVQRISVDPVSYRYHHLLQEAAGAQLNADEPAVARALHGRACEWYERRGDLEAAMRHAKQAGDLERVSRIVWAGAPGCVMSGRLARLQHWLADVSDEDVASDRRLTLAAALMTMQTGDAVAMTRWTLKAQAYAGADWRERAGHDEYAATLAAACAVQGDEGLAESERLCEAALRGLPVDSGYRAAAAFIRGVALTLQRDAQSGRRSLHEAERLGRALDAPLLTADSLSWQGVLSLLHGDTSDALRLISAASRIVDENDLDQLATSAHCLTARALALALRHDPAATSALTRARSMAVRTEAIAPWFAVCGRLVQARTAVLLGNGGLARLLIREARERMTPDLADSLAGDLLDAAEASLQALALDGVFPADLTAAELRVLAFLPTHLTFAQIGEHLYLSANTIKTHAMSIYRKLGARSRAEAVDHARTIGLMEGPLALGKE